MEFDSPNEGFKSSADPPVLIVLLYYTMNELARSMVDKSFGIEFWNKTVLTFANMIMHPTLEERDFDKDEIYFNKHLKQ